MIATLPRRPGTACRGEGVSAKGSTWPTWLSRGKEIIETTRRLRYDVERGVKRAKGAWPISRATIAVVQEEIDATKWLRSALRWRPRAERCRHDWTASSPGPAPEARPREVPGGVLRRRRRDGVVSPHSTPGPPARTWCWANGSSARLTCCPRRLPTCCARSPRLFSTAASPPTPTMAKKFALPTGTVTPGTWVAKCTT